jgi:hypothetical protein
LSRGDGDDENGGSPTDMTSADYWGMGCPQAENEQGKFQFFEEGESDIFDDTRSNYCAGGGESPPWQEEDDGIFEEGALPFTVPCLTNGDCPLGLMCCPIGICASDLNSCFDLNNRSRRSSTTRPERSDI